MAMYTRTRKRLNIGYRQNDILLSYYILYIGIIYVCCRWEDRRRWPFDCVCGRRRLFFVCFLSTHYILLFAMQRRAYVFYLHQILLHRGDGFSAILIPTRVYKLYSLIMKTHNKIIYVFAEYFCFFFTQISHAVYIHRSWPLGLFYIICMYIKPSITRMRRQR